MTVRIIETPTTVTVTSDDGPAATVVLEETVVTIAAPGPRGVPGPTGPQGPPGDPDVLGYVYTTSNPAEVHPINHGLPFKPGGVTCNDADGVQLIGFTVTHPSVGVTEVSFGAPVTPTIYLS